MAASSSEQVIREVFAGVNRGDLEGLVGMASDDFVVHSPVPIPGTGPDAFRTLMTVYFSAFPEQRVEVEDVIADGDRVAVRHTHHVVHGGELMGIPATGKAAVVPGIEIFRVKDGKVAEMWHQDDMLALMQQIGAIPGADGEE